MGKFLDRAGSFFFRKKWWVVGFWVLVLAIVGGCAAIFYQAPSSAISIPGTPAQAAIDRVDALFPNSGNGSGDLVFHTTAKPISAYQAAIEASLAKVKSVAGVVNVVSPFINPQAMSSDGKTAYAIVQFSQGTGEIDKSTLDQIADIGNNLSASSSGLEVERNGALVVSVPELFGATEVIGLLIAMLVLFLTFGALISAGMPLLNAVLGVGISIAGIFALSQAINANSTTPALSSMLGLAVGIDYSLFIISKYRNLLLEGYSPEKAVGKAIGTAGNAVVFAASTVIIALAALSVVNIPFMTTMGLAGAASIAVAALIALSLTPALLAVAGNKLFSRKVAQQIAAAQEKGPSDRHTVSHTTFWYRWGQQITKRPIIGILLGVVVVGFLAFPVTDLTLGLPNDQYAAATTTQHKAYDLLSNAFGVGYNAPLAVLVENVPPVTAFDRMGVQSMLTSQAQKQGNVSPAQLQAEIAQYSNLAEVGKISLVMAKLPDVKVATPALVTADGKNGLIQIIPNSAPSDQKTSDLINYLRNNQAQATGNPNVKLEVTGYTALQDDINKKLADALPVYLLVVVGLSLVLLLLAFRSILVPIKATLGFLFSVMAMFGTTVAVFQWGWFGLASPAPIISFIPIIGTGILFGLAMDYEFFLVSSMHDVYAKSHNAKLAVEAGFSLGAKVVTAAAAIMVSVFAGFAGSSDSNIKVFGLSLAVGVFVDAFIVRMTIIPGVMTLLGKSAWWLPSWLDKVLPHLSIEGEEDHETFEDEAVPEVPATTVK